MDRAKCWFRRRRATIEAGAILALLAGVSPVGARSQSVTEAAEQPQAHAQQAVAEIPPEFRRFLDTIDGFRAQFVQELWGEDQRLIEVASGTVELQRPGRFRWHYEQPWEQLIVADGTNLWMYDIDIAQVTRADLDVNDPANPATLLTGDADVLERFDVVTVSEIDGEVWVELMPKQPAGDYSTVRVGFDRVNRDGMLSALEFVDALEQTTVIRFESAEPNPDIAPERFEFDVPEGVHVLGGTG